MKATSMVDDLQRRREIVHQAMWLMAALMVVLLALVLDVRHQQVVLPVWGIALPESCWFKRLTGMDCPGCGLTRSVVCLVHGNFWDAWRFNPGGYLFLAVLAAQVPYRIAQIWRIRRGRSPWRAADIASAIVCCGTLILFIQWVCKWWGLSA
jgi:hypothetical protein